MAEERLIRKYANRRLYDAQDSRHVTLDDLRKLIAGGERIRVVDDKSGEDLTRSILLQIIANQEQFGTPVLSTQLLEAIIRFYGNPIQQMLTTYLERSIGGLLRQQNVMQAEMAKVLETPMAPLAEMTRQNMEMWAKMQASMLSAFSRLPRRARRPTNPPAQARASVNRTVRSDHPVDVRGKTILVTGAGRGIGRSLSEHFARKGAGLALLDTNAQDIEETRARCVRLGAVARTYIANAANEDSVVGALDQIANDFGSLDGLINNAGIVRDAMLVKVKDGQVVSKMSLEQWQSVIDVNLTGVFLCAREAAQRMIARGAGGVIVNISSICRAGNSGQTNYSAAKAGCHGHDGRVGQGARALRHPRGGGRPGLRAHAHGREHEARRTRAHDGSDPARPPGRARGDRARRRLHLRERPLHGALRGSRCGSAHLSALQNNSDLNLGYLLYK